VRGSLCHPMSCVPLLPVPRAVPYCGWIPPRDASDAPATIPRVRRWRNMVDRLPMSLMPLQYLLAQAARARRLATAIAGDPAALRLFHLAEEMDAEIVRLSRLDLADA
jgi:hypothetical protein